MNTNIIRALARVALALSVAASPIMLAGCSGPPSAARERRGGGTQATVLLDAAYAGAWPTGLDPATNTTARANLSLMNAIYGGLFQLVADEHGKHASVVGVLATGYEVVDDGRTVLIKLRPGVTFSDGTPFDAAAVRFNMERNVRSPCTCAPTDWPWVDGERITTPNDLVVALHFRRPYGAVINAFPVSTLNWIVSPTALKRLGEDQFRLTPVGAGPFLVVSNQPSSKLELTRNPIYWQAGRPYLDRLTFRSISTEQAAYQALLAGDAHAYEGMTSTSLIEEAKRNDSIVVTQQPATSPYMLQLNTKRAPFSDRRAREAVYHAIDVDAIRKGLFKDWYPVSQSFTGPGGLFFVERIPGYRSHDLARSRALVRQLGGFDVKIGTLRTSVAEQVVTALQTQLQRAGINVTIETYDLATIIREYRSGEWQAMLQTTGAYDPEGGAGIGFRFRSDGVYSGVRDETLDRILRDAATTITPNVRGARYFDAARHISDNAYAPFLFAFAPAQVAVRGLSGPGLTTPIPPLAVNTAVLWQDVRIEAN